MYPSTLLKGIAGKYWKHWMGKVEELSENHLTVDTIWNRLMSLCHPDVEGTWIIKAARDPKSPWCWGYEVKNCLLEPMPAPASHSYAVGWYARYKDVITPRLGVPFNEEGNSRLLFLYDCWISLCRCTRRQVQMKCKHPQALCHPLHDRQRITPMFFSCLIIHLRAS